MQKIFILNLMRNRFKNFKKKRYSEFLGWDNKPKMKFFDILDGKDLL